MQKMTVVALPKNMIESIENKQNKIKPFQKFNFAKFNTSQFRNNLFFLSIAFLLGRLVFLGDLAPFGLGIFAATAQCAKKKSIGVALAVLAGVVSSGRYEEVIIYIFSIVVYLKLEPLLTKLDKKMFAIPVTMFFSVLISGFTLNYMRDASLYAHMTVSFNALMCMISSQLFIYGVPLLLNKSMVIKAYKEATSEEMICFVVILALSIAGIGNIDFLDYHLQNIFSSILVMLLALAGGAGLGAAVGVIVGLVIGLSGNGEALNMIAFYAVSGMIAGVFKSLGKFAVILGFIFGSLIINLSFTQIPLLMNAITEVVIAAFILFFLPAVSLLNLQKDVGFNLAIQPVSILEGAGAKMQSVAQLFYEISSLLSIKQQENHEEKNKIDMNQFLSAIGVKVCETCSNRSVCWEENYYRTYQYMIDIFHQLEQAPLSGKDVGLAFREDCPQAGKVLDIINDIVEKNNINVYWNNKISEQKQVMGEQLKAAGNIITNLVQELNRPFWDNRKHVQTIQRRINQIGFNIENIKINGKEKPRQIKFEKDACGKNSECITYFLPIISDYLEERVTLTRKCGNKELGIKCKICTKASPNYSVNSAISYIAKDGKNICGDSIKITELNNGKISLLLSDGMGSGKKAAKESKLTVDCLSKLLLHDFDIDLAVKVVNSLLLLEASEESFATVDMALIDQYTGEAEFLKVASAPSFIKRVHEVKTIRAKALPIGILNQIELEPIKVKLAVNDVLVMVSDGIYDLNNIKVHSSDKEGWLTNFIRRNDVENEQKFADAILQEAMKMSGGNPKDDMSVLVMVIREGKFI